MKLIVILCLLGVCLSLTTLSYTFPTQANNLYTPPTYPLGLLNATNQVIITAQLINSPFTLSALRISIVNANNLQ